MDLSRTVASESHTLQDGLRELDSLAREFQDFLAHGQLVTSDMTGTVIASDVNMTLVFAGQVSDITVLVFVPKALWHVTE